MQQYLSDIQILRSEIKRIEKILNSNKSKKYPKIGIKELKIKQSEILKYADYVKDIIQQKRGLFVSLEHAPQTALESFTISQYIHDNRQYAQKFEKKIGGTPIQLGRSIIGTMLDCSLDLDWDFVNVYDALLLQCAHTLANGSFKPISNSLYSYDLPMTTLGTGNIGPLSRDVADNNPSGTRAPFSIYPIGGTSGYMSLANNDAKVQNTLIVDPDRNAIPKSNASESVIKDKLNTASRLHINILSRYNSQSLLVLYTKKPTLCAGSSLPNYYIKSKYEKAFTVWGNSSFGILLHWLHSGKQQFGRGISSPTSLPNMAVLDFDKLNNAQIQKFNKLFNTCAQDKFLTIMDLNIDKTRHKLDNGICDILGIDISLLEDVRQRLSQEPILHGQKIYK